MKVKFISVLVALSLSGCIVVSTKPSIKSKSTKPVGSNIIDFKPSSDITRVETRGQVICEPSKPCTELTFDWKSQNNNLYKLYTDLYDPTQYDIKKVVFTIDGQTYPYQTQNSTQYRKVRNSDLINSNNFVVVPSSFINLFNRASTIDISVITTQGPINHSVLTIDKQSYAYLTFKRGYNSQLNKK